MIQTIVFKGTDEVCSAVMSVRRTLVVLALVSLALPFTVFSWRARQMQQAETNRNLQYHVVGLGSLDVTVPAIGTIEARAVASLSFTRPGRVVEVLVEPGDGVKNGDALARLVSQTEEITYDQALLSLQLAQLQKQDLLDPTDESAIRIAEANLNSAWGAYSGVQNAIQPEDIRAAEIQYQQARDFYQAAIDARARAAGGQPDQAYQLLDAQVGASSFNAEIARLQLEALQNGTGTEGAANAAYARVVQAQRELERVKAGPTQAEIDRADLAIQQAQAQVDLALLALEKMTLAAPFDGVISAVNIEAGGLSTPGLPALELTDVSGLHVSAQIDEIDIRQVRTGMPTRIQLDALADVSLPGFLEQIALVGTNDNGIISYDVVVAFNALDPRARVGMTAEAAVIVEERVDVLIVPNIYIRLDRERGQAFVNLLNTDGVLEEVEVRLGLQGQDNSEIVSGLKQGDIVAVDLGSDSLSFLGG